MKVQRIEYRESESIVRDFLDKHHPTGTIPVPIELIIEKLGIHIVPIIGLRAVLGSHEGVLLRNRREILVDARQQDEYESRGNSRYLFTLAHELGHYVLHADFYAATKLATLDDYKTWYEELNPKVIDSLEIQANNFAGQVLLPDTTLIEEWERTIEEYGVMVEGLNEELVWTYAARLIRSRFGVSELCALHRIKLARKSGLLGEFK